MHKLLPFRQYDEKDVINLFNLKVGGYTLTNLVPGGTGNNKEFWSGTPVIPTGTDADATLTADDPKLTTDAYLGAIGAADQGFALQEGSQYPTAGMQVGTAGAAAKNVIGITLRATLAYDENGEKLLYYKEKLDELQGVLPGQAVPVVSRGFFTMNVSGQTTANPTIGHALKAAANGVFTAAAVHQGDGTDCGTILAKGDRDGDSTNETYYVQLNV